jgi:hypothetical protein
MTAFSGQPHRHQTALGPMPSDNGIEKSRYGDRGREV